VSIDKPLWVAMGAFGGSMGGIIFWLAEHHGTPITDRPMVLPCVVAIVALNVAYWRMSKLTHVWRTWDD